MSLLITVLFFLVAALIFAPIAKRYTFSTILGFTIAGLLLGPSVFKLIDDVDEIQLLTDLGMLAVLFFLGFYLKLDNKSLFVGGLLAYYEILKNAKTT